MDSGFQCENVAGVCTLCSVAQIQVGFKVNCVGVEEVRHAMRVGFEDFGDFLTARRQAQSGRSSG